MRNYFKVSSGQFIFFNGSKVADTSNAFSRALLLVKNDLSKISVYQLPDNGGPWDRVAIIGHRRRGEILGDIAGERNALELETRQAELDRLDRLYYAAGRDIVPTFEVVAV